MAKFPCAACSITSGSITFFLKKTKKSHPYNGWDTHVRTLKKTVHGPCRGGSCGCMAEKGLPGEPIVRPFPDSSYTTPFREGFGDTMQGRSPGSGSSASFSVFPEYTSDLDEKGFPITVAGPLGICTRFPVTSCFTQEHLACFHE